MKLHLVWSGQKSKGIAKHLEWLFQQQPLPAVLTCSSYGLGSARFYSRAQPPLGPQGIVLFCVTPENSADLWLSHHAGYLAASAEACRFACLCHEVAPEDIRGPLATLPSYPLTAAGLGEAISDLGEQGAESSLLAWLEGAWPRSLSELDRFLDALRGPEHGAQAIAQAGDGTPLPIAGRDQDREALDALLGLPAVAIIRAGTSYREQKQRHEAAFRRSVLEGVLRATQGDVGHASQWLELGRVATYLLMKRSGLSPRQFRPQPSAEMDRSRPDADESAPRQDSPPSDAGSPPRTE